MNKSEKDKKYTKDIVLNKILKDISEENLEPATYSENNANNNTYEDEMIKYYREKDILEKKQKYINMAKMISIFSIFILLILMITYYMNSTPNKQTEVQNIIVPAPISQPKVKEVSKPVKIEHIEEKPKEVIPDPINEPIKIEKVKTEREIAKELLLQQMMKGQ